MVHRQFLRIFLVIASTQNPTQTSILEIFCAVTTQVGRWTWAQPGILDDFDDFRRFCDNYGRRSRNHSLRHRLRKSKSNPSNDDKNGIHPSVGRSMVVFVWLFVDELCPVVATHTSVRGRTLQTSRRIRYGHTRLPARLNTVRKSM